MPGPRSGGRDRRPLPLRRLAADRLKSPQGPHNGVGALAVSAGQSGQDTTDRTECPNFPSSGRPGPPILREGNTSGPSDWTNRTVPRPSPGPARHSLYRHRGTRPLEVSFDHPESRRSLSGPPSLGGDWLSGSRTAGCRPRGARRTRRTPTTGTSRSGASGSGRASSSTSCPRGSSSRGRWRWCGGRWLLPCTHYRLLRPATQAISSKGPKDLRTSVRVRWTGRDSNVRSTERNLRNLLTFGPIAPIIDT